MIEIKNDNKKYVISPLPPPPPPLIRHWDDIGENCLYRIPELCHFYSLHNRGTYNILTPPELQTNSTLK